MSLAFGLVVGGRFKAKDLLPYALAQVAGAIAAAGVMYLIASGKAGFDLSGALAPTARASIRRAATR